MNDINEEYKEMRKLKNRIVDLLDEHGKDIEVSNNETNTIELTYKGKSYIAEFKEA